MFKRPVKLRLHAWIAMVGIVAILLNALVPSMSHLLARGGARTPAICSAPVGPGVKPVRLNAGVQQTFNAAALGAPGADQNAPTPAPMMQDCGYCLVHGGTDMLAPPAPGVLGFTGAHALRPLLFYRSPAPLLALSAAAPRGPPRLV